MRDPAMPQRDQVLHRPPGASQVVGKNGDRLLHQEPRLEQHAGNPLLLEPAIELPVLRVVVDDDHAVDRAVGRERFKIAVEPARGDRAHDQMAIESLEDRLGARDHAGEVLRPGCVVLPGPVKNEFDVELGGQGARPRPVDAVLVAAQDLQHARARLRPNVLVIVEHPRNRRVRDLGFARNVLQPNTHEIYSHPLVGLFSRRTGSPVNLHPVSQRQPALLV
ncbi:MAG: hypothetical protein BWZ08_02798 [candidate division BRC1 bacterium ADurb.BinA292]|nr:MAG: hypothetical protein BWZ08_02798 [candidate division BRC1 bacterium ADurb.BinA292]